MTDDVTQRADLARELIRQAGAIARGYATGGAALQVGSKGAQDVVTNADREIEDLIRARLRAAFPDDRFFGEESGPEEFDETSDIWVVDPIDGTQPFAAGLADWCISIAFVRRMRLVFGMVYAPMRDELFQGGADLPATLNDRPIHGHPGQALSDGITGVGHSPRVPTERFLPVLEGVLRQGGMFCRNGSGALTLCDVAAGRLLGYVEQHINSWDCLGAMAVLQASGHHVSDMVSRRELLLRGGPIAVAKSRPVFDLLSGLVGAPPGPE